MHFAILHNFLVYFCICQYYRIFVFICLAKPFLRQQFCAVTTYVSANKKCSAITAVFGQEKWHKQLYSSSGEMQSQLSRTEFPGGNQFSVLSAIIGIMIGFFSLLQTLRSQSRTFGKHAIERSNWVEYVLLFHFLSYCPNTVGVLGHFL